MNKFDPPEDFVDLEEWMVDFSLFMEGLCNPHKIDELWQQSKAKKIWDSFQSSFESHQTPWHQNPQPTQQSNHPFGSDDQGHNETSTKEH